MAAPFHEVLRETKAWCAAHGDARAPRTSLRSRDTQPPKGAGLEESLFFVAEARRKHVETMNPPVDDGRIAVYSPDDNLFDGAAELASEGYFDVNNQPPWDTWLTVAMAGEAGDRRSHLLAWVPSTMVPFAARGIDANPERCIRWLEDCDLSVRWLVGSSSG